jgi:transposase
VSFGLRHRSLEGITAIGIDEMMLSKGTYHTVVYQLDNDSRRLLWIGKDRRAKTLMRFFFMLGKERRKHIKYVCSDMWAAYLKVVAHQIPDALHILDRFHIVANLNKALNQVRASEAKKLHREGYEPVLKGSRYSGVRAIP